MATRIVLLAVLLITALCGGGRSLAQSGAVAGRERFSHVSSEQGLSQGTVYAFSQDRQGFLWMGTQNGLNRWDGYEMRVWKHDPLDPRSLSQGYIRALLATEDDHLWIGTEGGGLDQLDLRTGAVKRCRLPGPRADAAGSSVFCLAARRDGTILIGGTMGLLMRDPRSGQYRSVELPNVRPDDPEGRLVFTMLVDRDDGIWLGTKYGLVHLPADGGRPVHHRHDPQDPGSLPQDNIKALYQDAGGHLWVGTYGGGLCRMAPEGGRFEPFARSAIEFVYGITEDLSGDLWVATFNGLHVLDAGRRHLRSHHKDILDPHAPRSDLVLATFRDRTGRIWASTSGQGVCLTDPAPDRFHVLDDLGGTGPRLSERFVYGIHEDAQGRLLIATAGGGVNVWDRRTDSLYVLPTGPAGREGPGSDVARCVLEDWRGRLWVGTDKGGLYRRDAEGRHRRYRQRPSVPSSLPSNVVLTLYEDRTGTIWAGTYGGGLARYNEATDDFTTVAPSTSTPGAAAITIVRCILEDRHGGLWIGTGGTGLFRLDPDRVTFHAFVVEPGVPGSITSNFIRCLHEARDGTLWVGTNGGGLCMLREPGRADPVFVPFTLREGMADNVVYGIAEAASGDLWLSTNTGLSELHIERLHGMPDAGVGTQAPLFTHHAAHHGVQQGEFNGGAYLRDRSGRMYFGGVNGITHFHPDSMDRSERYPPVLITDLQVRNKPVLVDTASAGPANHLRQVGDQYRSDRAPSHIDTLVIPYAASMFSFTFSAIGFTDPEEASYHYILEGLDREWNSIGARRFISFTNLDPGSYVLKLGASSTGRPPAHPGRVLHIIIDPPFWMTRWFRGAVLLLIAITVALAVHLRYRKLARENLRMQQLVEERTRELSEQKSLVEDRNTRLEELNTLNRRILAVISHDFKGPLISMRLLIDLLRHGRYDRLDLHTTDIHDQLMQSELILQNLLDWARLELGERGQAADAEARAAEVVRAIVAELEPMGREKALHVNIELETGNTLRVPLDVLRIVYRNLISNALKYSPAGGHVTCGHLDAADEYFVCDQGQGIAPELVDRIFKGAVHPRPGTHHEKGFGLGLYLTAELIARHGGTIRVETGRDGSCFYFRFP